MTLACLVVKHCGKELLDKGQAALANDAKNLDAQSTSV